MIAVIGGRGVIGQAIVGALRAADRDVTVVTHNLHLLGAPGFRYGDMLYPETLALALEGAEVVIQSATSPAIRSTSGEVATPSLSSTPGAPIGW